MEKMYIHLRQKYMIRRASIKFDHFNEIARI